MTTKATSSGLDGVVVAETAISDVDGERGRLVIAGSDVEQLAASSSYEAAVTRVLAMSTAACETIGAAARAWFISNKQGFFGRVQHAMEELKR